MEKENFKTIDDAAQEKILDMLLEELPFKSEKNDKKVKGQQYQLALKRAYIFLQPHYVEQLREIVGDAYKRQYKESNWKFSEDEFEKFLDNFSTRKEGGRFFTASAVAKYIRETPVTLRDLFEFGVDKIFDAKGVGKFTKELFLDCLKELGVDYENLKNKYEKRRLSLKKGIISDPNDLVKRLRVEGVRTLEKIPARAFKPESASSKQIKTAFNQYFQELKENLEREKENGLGGKNLQTKIESFRREVNSYQSIVEQKLLDLKKLEAASQTLDSAFAEFDKIVGETDCKYHHKDFMPKQKAHLNPRENIKEKELGR